MEAETLENAGFYPLKKCEINSKKSLILSEGFVMMI